jgi:EAL domain-containing protein (putative c-di-GMP-specific phosphodiesterase class I)
VRTALRWPREDGQLAEPDDFLPLIRRHGLMASVTEFVLNRALDDATSWRAASADVPLAVNLFAPSVADLGFPRDISLALADRGLNPATLTLEITEDLLLDNIERTQIVLNKLRHNGIRVAIDDFGTGYSALSYLRDLPIDEVKLDRHFILPILAIRGRLPSYWPSSTWPTDWASTSSRRASRTPRPRRGCAITAATLGRDSS